MKIVALTKKEQERLLYWLHKPRPPGPEKEMDNRLIRKIT